MPLERAVEVLDQPQLEAAADLVEALPPDRAVSLLTAMSADRRVDIFRHLKAPARDRLLARLGAQARASLVQLLAYPENTAGAVGVMSAIGTSATYRSSDVLFGLLSKADVRGAANQDEYKSPRLLAPRPNSGPWWVERKIAPRVIGCGPSLKRIPPEAHPRRGTISMRRCDRSAAP
jgi:hypothetical protein